MEMSDQYRGEWLIYGDFPRLFDFKIQSTLEEAARLYGTLQDLDRSLLTAFISYVLARADFTPRYIFELTGKHTTDFKDEDWIEEIDTFEWSEELREWSKIMGDLAEPELLREHAMWSHYYENVKTKETFKVIFVSRMDPSFMVLRTTDGDLIITHHIDVSIPSYFIIHPWTYKQARKDFRKEFGELKENMASKNAQFLSTDEFVHRFIPDEKKKYLTIENWISIRNGILEKLHKDWPVLTYASKIEQIAKIADLFRNAHVEYEKQEFDHAIMDIGSGCEALLRILYHVNKGREPESDIGFHDLLNSMKEMIEEDFGKNIYADLDFIREWRNKTAHATNPVSPSDDVTFQIIKRADIFYELLKRIFKPFSLE